MPDEKKSRFVGDGSEIVVPGDARYDEVSQRIAREEAERKEIGRKYLEEKAQKAATAKAGTKKKG